MSHVCGRRRVLTEWVTDAPVITIEEKANADEQHNDSVVDGIHSISADEAAIETEIDAEFDQLDRNHDGVIDRHEWEAACPKYAQATHVLIYLYSAIFPASDDLSADSTSRRTAGGSQGSSAVCCRALQGMHCPIWHALNQSFLRHALPYFKWYARINQSISRSEHN